MVVLGLSVGMFFLQPLALLPFIDVLKSSLPVAASRTHWTAYLWAGWGAQTGCNVHGAITGCGSRTSSTELAPFVSGAMTSGTKEVALWRMHIGGVRGQTP